MFIWREGLLHNGDLIFLESGYITTHVHSARAVLTPDDYLTHCQRLHVSPHQGGNQATKISPLWFTYGNGEHISLANGVYMHRTAFAQKISAHLLSLLY